MTRAFWWRGRPNFGDALAPVLLERFAGVRASWAPPEQADVVVIGSIATMLPPRFAGAVLGIGTARDVWVDLSRARVYALRGPLTAAAAGVARDVVLGDPGLLAGCLLDTWPDPVHELGVVPHWQDRSLAPRFPGALVVDVGRPPLEVIAAIASCRRIVSSSLHGLVIADALGIPRRWETFPRVQGGGFKFRDYAASIGQDLVPGTWGEADPRVIEEMVQRLLCEAFPAYAATVPS